MLSSNDFSLLGPREAPAIASMRPSPSRRRLRCFCKSASCTSDELCLCHHQDHRHDKLRTPITAVNVQMRDLHPYTSTAICSCTCSTLKKALSRAAPKFRSQFDMTCCHTLTPQSDFIKQIQLLLLALEQAVLGKKGFGGSLMSASGQRVSPVTHLSSAELAQALCCPFWTFAAGPHSSPQQENQAARKLNDSSFRKAPVLHIQGQSLAEYMLVCCWLGRCTIPR